MTLLMASGLPKLSMLDVEQSLADLIVEWNAGGSKENLGKIFKGFGPKIAALISHVDDESLKLWSLLDMEVLPTWVNGRLALMGDAAHPFLPRE